MLHLKTICSIIAIYVTQEMLFSDTSEVLKVLKILVLSDTHHMISNAVSLIERLNPDYIIHLGDMCEDCHRLEDMFPRKLIISVMGNNDFFDRSYPLERCFELGGKKIFMCHGHKYNVKSSLLRLIYKGKELGADIILYGHTHVSYIDDDGSLLIMNPGSVGTYGIIEINEGKIEAKIEKYAN